MKKGLLLTLVIAVALLSSSVFAYAPVLKNLPDIIIGDVEEGASNNFFVFSDAFVFDSYVTDRDSTPATHIKWSFANTVVGAQTILINGLDEETADVTFKDPTNELRAVSSTASFRNVTASPLSGNTPFDAVPLEDVKLAVYVSDGTFVVSDEITVYTINDVEDGLSEGKLPIWTDSFETGARWNAYSGATVTIAPSSVASYDSVNKRLACKFPALPLPAPGYFPWLQSAVPPAVGVDPVIAYEANHFYVLKTVLSSDANDSVPAIRIRTQALDNIWTSCMLNGADGAEAGQSGAAQTGGVEFRMVFQPQGTTADGFIAVDMFGALSYTGEVYVDEMSLYSIEIGAEATLTSVATVNNFSAWGYQGTASHVTSKVDGNVTITDPANDWFAAVGGFVLLPTACAPGDYYRLGYNVAKNAVTNYTEQIRLRVSDTKNGNYNSNFVYNDNNAAATLHITTTPQRLYLWHSTMNGRSSTFPGDLSVFFDYIESAVGVTNASVTLSNIQIEKATLPPLN